MRPLHLAIRGFATYEDTSIDLSNDHLLAVGGRNGRGKSWFLDTIRFAAFGGCRCDSTEELIRWGATEVYVSLTFASGGETYRVTRQRNVKGKSTLQLDQLVDGQWHSITCGTIQLTDKLISRITGLTDSTFVTTSYMLQHDSGIFTRKMSGLERKRMLTDMLELGLLDALGEQARKRAAEARVETEAHRVRLQQLEQRLGIVHEEHPLLQKFGLGTASEIEVALSLLSDLVLRKEAAQEAAQRRQEELVQAEASIAQLEQAEKRATEIRREISQCDETHINDREEAEERHLATRRRRERELRAAHDQTEKAVISRGTEARRAVDQAEARHRDLLADVRRLEDELARTPLPEPELVTKLTFEVDDLEQKRTAADNLHHELQRIKREAEAATSVRERERDLVARDLDRDRQAASRLTDEVGCIDLPRARCLYLADAQAAAARIPRIEQRLAGLQTATAEESLLWETAVSLKLQVDALKFSHADLQQARRDLEIYRRREIEAERRPAIQEQLNRVLAEYQKLDAELPELQASCEALREELLSLRAAQAQELKAELDSIDRAAHEEQERIATTAAARRRELVDRLDQVLPRGQQPSGQLVADARDRARESWAKVESLSQEIGGAQARLARLREEEAELEPARAAVSQLAREQGQYETLARVFHPKSGAQVELIRQEIIPELEARANHLLGVLTGGEMRLAILTERENRSGTGQQNVFDIKIWIDGHEISYEACSGAQQIRVDFSLRLSLSYLLAARSGTRLEMLAIDEGFGAQDEPAREALLDTLEAVRADFSLILVVCHLPDVLSRLPARIEVYRDAPGQGSKIRRVA